MKKVLVSAFFGENLGDDLFLKILFDRYSNIEWHLLHARKRYHQIFNNYTIKSINFIHPRFYKINEMRLRIKQYDAFIKIGGSIFMQEDNWKKSIEKSDYLVNKFNKANKKSFILGANFGPFTDEKFRDRYEKTFQKYHDICFRDKYSFDLFNKLENIRLAPDIIFQLKSEEVYKDKKAIGISIMNFNTKKDLKQYNEKYQNKMKEVIEKYSILGYKVTLFSFCSYEGDEEAINQIMDKVDFKYKANVEIFNYRGNIDEFLSKYKSMNTIVGIRFHSIILSQVFNQTVYPIIYSEKTLNTLKDIKLDRNYIYLKNIDELDVDEVIRIAFSNKIDCDKLIKDSEKHFKVLDLLMNGESRR